MVHLVRKLEHFSLQLQQKEKLLGSMAGAATTWMPLESICNTGLGM